MKKNKPLNTQEYKHSFDKVLYLIDEAKHQVYKQANKTLIESWSLSPTVIADYETELIPKQLLKRKVEELYRLYEGESDEK